MSTETITSLKNKLIQLENDYKAERSNLEKKIAEAQKTHQVEAIAKIKSLMEEHGLTPESLQFSKRQNKSKSSKSVPPKYRGPEGQTWTGRGRQPKWIGNDREKYAIK